MKALVASLTALAAMVALAARAFSAPQAAHTFPPYWPTAVPTVASTTAPPAGGALIRDMYATAQRLGSVHTVTTIDFEDPDIEHVHGQMTEDISQRTFRSSYVETLHTIPLSPITRESSDMWVSRDVGRILADRQVAPAPARAWHCQTVSSRFAREYPTVDRWNHITEVKNLGAALVDSQLAWHVTAFGVRTQPRKHKTSYVPLDYYIAQSDHTLVRELSATGGGGRSGLIRYAMVIDYSRWGEPVKVTVPKACSKKSS
jgi:hypothetical protein